MNMKKVVFSTKRHAEEVLSDLHKILESYGLVRVSDLYERADPPIECEMYDFKHGWRDLDGFKVALTAVLTAAGDPGYTISTTAPEDISLEPKATVDIYLLMAKSNYYPEPEVVEVYTTESEALIKGYRIIKNVMDRHAEMEGHMPTLTETDIFLGGYILKDPIDDFEVTYYVIEREVPL